MAGGACERFEEARASCAGEPQAQTIHNLVNTNSCFFNKCSSSDFLTAIVSSAVVKNERMWRSLGMGWKKRAINRWHRGGGGIPILDLRSRRRGQWVTLYPAWYCPRYGDALILLLLAPATICACECRYLEAPHKMRLVWLAPRHAPTFPCIWNRGGSRKYKAPAPMILGGGNKYPNLGNWSFLWPFQVIYSHNVLNSPHPHNQIQKHSSGRHFIIRFVTKPWLYFCSQLKISSQDQRRLRRGCAPAKCSQINSQSFRRHASQVYFAKIHFE